MVIRGNKRCNLCPTKSPFKLMNIRQQLYKKHRLEGYSAYVAAIKAGYSKNTAKNANKYMEKYGMAEWLEAQGLTDAKLAEHAEQGLNANRVISAVKGTPANGATCDFIDVPDWNVRHKYFNTILQLRNKLSDKPLIDQSKHFHYVIIRNPKAIAEERTEAELPTR